MSQHDHSLEEERQIREAALDQTIAESFPASDPASTIPNPDDEDSWRRQRNRATPPVKESERKRRSVDD